MAWPSLNRMVPESRERSRDGTAVVETVQARDLVEHVEQLVGLTPGRVDRDLGLADADVDMLPGIGDPAVSESPGPAELDVVNARWPRTDGRSSAGRRTSPRARGRQRRYARASRPRRRPELRHRVARRAQIGDRAIRPIAATARSARTRPTMRRLRPGSGSALGAAAPTPTRQ